MLRDSWVYWISISLEAAVIIIALVKANIDAADNDGCTALELAEDLEHTTIVKLLRSRGAG